MKCKFALSACIAACLLSLCGLFSSCRNYLDLETSEIAVYLPFGQEDGKTVTFSREASADSISYSYVVNFTDKNGVTTELSGNSGEQIVLKPATPGDYDISGSAFDDRGKMRYQGDCTATAHSGKKTDVELTLYAVDISSESKHVKLEHWEKGIKITVSWREGDGQWEFGNTYMYNEDTGSELKITSLPEKDKPVVMYCSLTDPGYIYSFHCELNVGSSQCSESVSILAKAGDSSYIYYDDDYYKTSLTLDSSGTLKIGKDITSYFDSNKIRQIKDIDYYFDFYGLNSDVSAPSDKAVWLSCSRLSYSEKASFIKNGLNLWEAFAESLGKLTDYKYFYVYLCVEFTDPLASSTIVRTPFICSDKATVNKPAELKTGKHITIEPVSDGIKIQLKWLDGDGELEDWSGVTEVNSKIKFDFYGDNVKPSSNNTSLEYIYPFTTAGETYEFVYGFSGGEYHEERVWCKATGGIGSVYDSAKWRKTKISIDYDSVASEYMFKFDTTPSSVVSSDKYSRFKMLKLDTQIWGGLSDFSNAAFLSGHELDLTTSMSEGDYLLTSNTLDYFGTAAKYRIAGYSTFFIQSTMKFKIVGCDTDFVSEAVSTQVNYTGPVYTDKYIEGTEDKGKGWDIYYSCFEKDYQKFKMTSFENDSVAFSLSGSFDNDTFELQIRKALTSVQAGQKYSITFNLKCTEALESFEYDVFDDSGFVAGGNIKDLSGVPAAANTSIPVTLVVDSTNISGVASLSLIPFTSGSYSISDLNVTEVN